MAELVLVRGGKPRMVKARKNSWTKAKQEAFLAELGATCNIAAALRKVKKSRSGLDRLRQRDAGFRARLEETVSRAYGDLELFTLKKMMDGTVKTVTKPDGGVETVHEYPLHLAVQLLRLHKDRAPGTEPDLVTEDKEAVVARLVRKIGAVRRRLEKEAAASGKALEQ